ncbi:hypothetical protein LZ30DRAFT_683475 [Colletotrichum cereale]|nr:hypothetical protein LZ30DRAFT_683475 [Colletotrichum cereale]
MIARVYWGRSISPVPPRQNPIRLQYGLGHLARAKRVIVDAATTAALGVGKPEANGRPGVLFYCALLPARALLESQPPRIEELGRPDRCSSASTSTSTSASISTRSPPLYYGATPLAAGDDRRMNPQQLAKVP